MRAPPFLLRIDCLAVGGPWEDSRVAGIRTDNVPPNLDGPSLVAAASGLMLLAENSSRWVRLHRLAALGMALPDSDAPSLSPSAVRSILKREDVGGEGLRMQEDQYSEVLIQSISFFGGPYLVSPGSGEHTVADVENLLDAAFRDQWMPDELRIPARQLARGLLIVSDIVIKKAGLKRGTEAAGYPRIPIDVPGAARLKELTDATFVSNDELDARGKWLRMVVDTFALDPAQLVGPCATDIVDDRLYLTPFLRLPEGYRVALPLDLLITLRFHLLRFIREAGQLDELGQRWRDAAFRRFMRLLPRDSSPTLLEESEVITRYLLPIDSKRDLHLILATDPLVDWQEEEVWGRQDTREPLARLESLVSPDARRAYSTAEELLHLLIVDSPGRAAFWGVPNIDGTDPMLIARSDDLEVIMHEEPDGLLGLLLLAQAIDRRPGESMSTDILDEFSSYIEQQKSFYLSDDAPPNFIFFQPGDGLHPRQKYHAETDRHGVVSPLPNSPILPASRRYEKDAPEIFVTESGGSYLGYVVELGDRAVFVTMDLKGSEFVGVEPELLECVAYWVLECAIRASALPAADITELVLKLSNPEAWKTVGEWSKTEPAVRVAPRLSSYVFEFTETFLALLQEDSNAAERELVAALLADLFGLTAADIALALDAVAPLGPKRMLNAFDQNHSPDMLSAGLPRPLTGHEQVTAQLLDELGEWLRDPDGGGMRIGGLEGQERVRVLNLAVGHLFEVLQREIARFEQRSLLDFLICQNEALAHNTKVNAIMLRSRLACFGAQSSAASELVQQRKESASAHRANRFLIEYVAAQPPTGSGVIETGDYYHLLAISREIIERATASDFLHYELADFEVSILKSGRLGLSRDEPVTVAMDAYAAASGLRTVRDAQGSNAHDGLDDFDVKTFIASSESAMREEFGFTLHELREVCGGLLDIGVADAVTRIARSTAVAEIAAKRGLPVDVVDAVLGGITLSARAEFSSIGPDAWPWRFNRDMSYVRRPLVLQGEELVFGFRSIYRLGPYWLDNLLSGRLQGRANTIEMQRCITEARRKINDSFARSVGARLDSFGLASRLSVNKIAGHRIVDSAGADLGDIDVLAVEPHTRSIIAIEAKDFEIARTPSEIANELEKLFLGKGGKKSTVELHGRRLDWLEKNLDQVVGSFGFGVGTKPWRVIGMIVTSEPLITPLVASSPLPVVTFDNLGSDMLNVAPQRKRRPPKSKRRRR